MSATTHPVVIGVNGAAQDEGALRVGVSEAHRLRVGVRVVHVVPDYVAISPVVPLTHADLAELGSEILKGAARALRQIDADIELETELLHGSRVHRLTEATQDAPVLVVGRDDRTMLDRLLRGNTATGVAATAACPVLTVPGGWHPSPARGAVLVGVKSSAHLPELLEDAFALAAASDSRLVALHAWKFPNAYDDIVADRVSMDDWVERGSAQLDSLLTAARRRYPDVKVDALVVHDRPAKALVEASREADVLVVVRREHGVPAAAHLGGTARSLLHSSDCPVRVVPARAGG